jgi:serine/threonine protein kinase
MRVCPTCGKHWADDIRFCGRDGVALERVTDALEGKRIGPYRIDVLIGRGAFGSVYRAHKSQDDSAPVALKVLRRDRQGSQELVGRFRREMRAVAALRHPHLVELVDLGWDEVGGYYVVMELLRGESVLDRIERLGALPVHEIDRILTQILPALAHAHEAGVIHRDIKAENIFLEERTEGLVARLLDFGLAKIDAVAAHDSLLLEATDQLTRPDQALGSPATMSPEQVMNMGVDLRSDIYSMGVVLFEMLTGELPFDSDKPLVIMQKHVHDAPPAPSSRKDGAWVPSAVDALVLSCMSKRPSLRPQTALELLAQWQECLTSAKASFKKTIAYRV